jgi:hypothetical protein
MENQQHAHDLSNNGKFKIAAKVLGKEEIDL